MAIERDRMNVGYGSSEAGAARQLHPLHGQSRNWHPRHSHRAIMPARGGDLSRPAASAPGHLSAGFTLIEMLATVCVLVIVLGMMVSLARYVRERSAQELTRDLLVRLDQVTAQYRQRNADQLPPVPALGDEVDELALQRYAAASNLQFVRAIRTQLGMADSLMAALPLYVYDERSVRDTWGSHVLFLPRQHPAVGMAPGDRFFFVSAGPDRKFLTRDDNLYSYEAASTDLNELAEAFTPASEAQALPAGHGQAE